MAKLREEQFAVYSFAGGMNVNPAVTADDECGLVLNMHYVPGITAPEAFPSESVEVNDSAGTVVTAVTRYNGKSVIAVNGGVYYDNSGTWALVTSISGTWCRFLVYNDLLIIADGTKLKAWDGTNAWTIGDGSTTVSSQPDATHLNVVDATGIVAGERIWIDRGGSQEEAVTVSAVVGNQLTVSTMAYTHVSGESVVDSVDAPSDVKFLLERDQRLVAAGDNVVYMSRVTDQTDWSSTYGISLDIGYLDEGTIKELVLFSDDIYVFKGPKPKRIYKITGHSSSTYQVEYVRDGHTASMAVSAGNNVYFSDGTDLKSLAGIVEYGDVGVSPESWKVRGEVISGASQLVAFIGYMGQVWWVPDTTNTVMYVFHIGRGVLTRVLWSKPLSAVFWDPSDDTVYLGFNDGKLYTWTGSPMSWEIRTKAFDSIPGLSGSMLFRKLLRDIELDYVPLVDGSLTFSVVVDNAEYRLLQSSFSAGGTYLIDQTEDLIDATYDLAGGLSKQSLLSWDDIDGYVYHWKVSGSGSARLVGVSARVGVTGRK